MVLQTPLTVIDSQLQVIGFNAFFNDLENIDQVEASLYRGEPLSNSTLLSSDHVAQYKRCINRILSANKLATQQVSVILVGTANELVDAAIKELQLTFQYESDLTDALQRSEQIIKTDNVAVMIISAALPTDIKNVEKSTISFDNEFEGYAKLQGAACLLLCSESFAESNNSVVYSKINSVASGAVENIESVIETALTSAGINANNKITTLEVSASSDNSLNNIEQQALINSYNNVYSQGDKFEEDKLERDNHRLSTALSCQKSVLGENGALSELMSVIYSIISLQQRYRPSIKDWQSPSSSMLPAWLCSSFYLFNQAAPVYPEASGQPRHNAVSLVSQQRACHIVLTESDNGEIHQNGFNNNGKQSLFIIAADDESSLLDKLNQLALSDVDDIKTLAKQLYVEHKNNSFTYKVVLIAESVYELRKEISQSLIGIKNAFKLKTDWKTPKGSYFTSQPDKNAKTAFLYPGIGATYIGLGRDLMHLFPEIYPSVIAIADNIGASLKDELLNPRSVVALGFKQLKQLDLELRNSLANIAECGVGYACVFTKIFEQVFNIKADFAGGYSMGEISMFAALGCWQTPGLMSARLANSDTFNHQLSCELRSVRKLWDLPDIEDGQFEQIWETYSIKGTVEQISAEIRENERVYITIVNTPDSLVIGGFPADCLAFIKRIGVRAMPLNMPNAIHSEPAYQEYENMLELYSMPVTERIDTKMVSTSLYLPIPQHQKAISVSIAKCLCEPVDFPRLINTLADKNVKVFIEMGAGRSLSSWTDKTLKDKNNAHITVPVNAKGTDDQLTYARAVAKLLSFGVEMNIERYFSGSLIVNVQ